MTNLISLLSFENKDLETKIFSCGYTLGNEIKISYFLKGRCPFLMFLDEVVEKNLGGFVEFYVCNLSTKGPNILDSISISNIFFEFFINKNAIYWIKFKYGSTYFLIRCLYRILPLSSKNLGFFNNLNKNLLPYLFFNENNLNYEGKIPSEEFWLPGDYEIFLSYWDSHVYTLKNEINNYFLKLLCELNKISNIIFKLINQEGLYLLKNNFSTPALAHSLFFKKYNSNNCTKSLNDREDAYVRQAYFGGRCEVFGNPLEDEMVSYYDVPGMYAQCMLENFHLGKGYFDVPLNFEKPGFYSIRFKSDIKNFPVLPRKNQRNEIFFSNGMGEGVYWFEEILYFIEKGGFVEAIEHALLFPQFDKIFSDYVNKFTSIRKEGYFQNIFGKFMINSLYGSLGLSKNEYITYLTYSESETAVLISNFDVKFINKINSLMILTIAYDPRLKKLNKQKDSNRNVSLAAAITAKARIKLHKIFLELEKKKLRILYCDTDSAYVSLKKDEHSPQFNEISLVGTYDDAVFFSPKTLYLFEKNMSHKELSEFSLLKAKLYSQDEISKNKREFSKDKKFTSPLWLNSFHPYSE